MYPKRRSSRVSGTLLGKFQNCLNEWTPSPCWLWFRDLVHNPVRIVQIAWVWEVRCLGVFQNQPWIVPVLVGTHSDVCSGSVSNWGLVCSLHCSSYPSVPALIQISLEVKVRWQPGRFELDPTSLLSPGARPPVLWLWVEVGCPHEVRLGASWYPAWPMSKRWDPGGVILQSRSPCLERQVRSGLPLGTFVSWRSG